MGLRTISDDEKDSSSEHDELMNDSSEKKNQINEIESTAQVIGDTGSQEKNALVANEYRNSSNDNLSGCLLQPLVEDKKEKLRHFESNQYISESVSLNRNEESVM